MSMGDMHILGSAVNHVPAFEIEHVHGDQQMFGSFLVFLFGKLLF